MNDRQKRMEAETKTERLVKRVDPRTKRRLQRTIAKHCPGYTEADLLGWGLDLLLPQIESGKFNPLTHKAAA